MRRNREKERIVSRAFWPSLLETIPVGECICYIADAAGNKQLIHGRWPSFIAACGDFQDTLPLVKEKRASVVEPSEGKSNPHCKAISWCA